MCINPCAECLVFPVCGDTCRAKLSYGLQLDIYVEACLNGAHGLEITDYVKYKKLQVTHKDEMMKIEIKMRERHLQQRLQK